MCSILPLDVVILTTWPPTRSPARPRSGTQRSCGWKQRAQGKETFTQAETSALVLAGERVRLMPTQQGIWKPRDFTAALAIRTV